jgi:hypothetical protein
VGTSTSEENDASILMVKVRVMRIQSSYIIITVTLTLMTGASCPSAILVSTYNTTQRQNPEDNNLNTHQSENPTANIHVSWLYYKFTATTAKVNGQANR